MRLFFIGLVVAFGCLVLPIGLASARSKRAKQVGLASNGDEESLLETIRKLAKEAGHENPDSIGENRSDGVCYSKKCLETSVEFLEAMNYNADPCDSKGFGKFSCERRLHRDPNNWHQSSYGNQSQVAHVVYSSRNEALSFLADKIHKTDSIPLKSAKVAYKQCVNQVSLLTGSTSALYQVSKDFGGWPLLTGKPPTDQYDPFDMMAFISQFQSISLLFEIQSFKTDKGHEIILDKGHIVQTDDLEDLLPKYFNLIKSVKDLKYILYHAFEEVDKIPQPTETALNTLASNVVVQRVQIAKNADLGLGKPMKRMTIAELTKFTSTIDWERFFRKVFEYSHVEITPDTIVHVNKAYIKSIIYFFYNDPMNMANILHHEIWSMFKKATYVGYDSTKTLDELDCYSGVSNIFGASLTKEFIKRTKFPQTEKVKNDMQTMMARLKNTLIETLASSPVLTENTKKYLVEKFTKTQTFLGYPEWVDDKELMDYYHEKLRLRPLVGKDDGSTYLQNLMNMAAWQVGVVRDGIEKKEDNVHYWDLNSFLVDMNGATFHPFGNALKVPISFSSPPIYNVEVPGYVRYGGIGTVLAHELGHGMDTGGIKYDKDGNIKSKTTWFDEDSKKEYEKWTEGIKKNFRGAKIHYHGPWTKGINETLNPNITINDDIADTVGLTVSFKAYKKWLSEQPGQKDMQLPGLEKWTDEQLFFVKYSNMWCAEMTEDNALTVWTSNHSPDYNRATVPLKHSKAFSETFGCDFKKLSEI